MERGVGMKREKQFESGKRKNPGPGKGRLDRWRERRRSQNSFFPSVPTGFLISLNKACHLCGSVTFLISIRLHNMFIIK